jgi:leader peptidase (prepilin peptidase)/N-methyltransferase
MVLAVILSGLAGLVAARSIVAEADAHRRDLPDRWWDPICECGASLDAVLGRCRDGHRQRWLDPALLVASVLLLGALPLVIPTLWVVPGYLLFVATALLLTVTDLDTKLLPNRILVRAGIPSVVLLVVGGLFASEPAAVLRSLAAGAVYFTGMLVLALLARGALGFGDVKLAALLGVFAGYLGWGHLGVAVVGSFIVAGVTALLLLVFRLAGRRDHIPFGPFMVVATLIAIYAGDAILEWYRM